MLDPSVKEIELGTVTDMIKYNEENLVELEEKMKSMEVLSNQINVVKEEAQQELAHVKMKVACKSTLKGAKHISDSSQLNLLYTWI